MPLLRAGCCQVISGVCWEPGQSEDFSEALIKEKGNISSVPLPRGRLDKVRSGAGAKPSKESICGFWELASNPWVLVMSALVQLGLRYPVFSVTTLLNQLSLSRSLPANSI